MAGGAAFPAALRAALARGLPGPAAQDRARPPFRARVAEGESAGYRPAAVLVLLYPASPPAAAGEAPEAAAGPAAAYARLRFPLIRRPDSMRSHPGQVALPGGALEAGEGPEEAALREAEEELGIAPERVEPLGRLSPLAVEPSRFLVTPVLAWSAARPAFRPAPAEVEALYEPRLVGLLSAEIHPALRRIRGIEREVPALSLDGVELWGATAMILCELAALLR